MHKFILKIMYIISILIISCFSLAFANQLILRGLYQPAGAAIMSEIKSYTSGMFMDDLGVLHSFSAEVKGKYDWDINSCTGLGVTYQIDKPENRFALAFGMDYYPARAVSRIKGTEDYNILIDGGISAKQKIDVVYNNLDMSYEVSYYFIQLKYYFDTNQKVYIGGEYNIPKLSFKSDTDSKLLPNNSFGAILGVRFDDFLIESKYTYNSFRYNFVDDFNKEQSPQIKYELFTFSMGYVFDTNKPNFQGQQIKSEEKVSELNPETQIYAINKNISEKNE